MSSEGIVQRALSSLGKGIDLTSDFRLKYCKGENRLVLLNETNTRELSVPGYGTFKDVSIDIKCDKGDRTRYQSDILDFNQMSEFFNQKCSVPGKIPSGLFNSSFGFQSGSWTIDAANTKYLGLDGYFIVLFNVHIDRFPLILADHVRNAVPSTWDPSALARLYLNLIQELKHKLKLDYSIVAREKANGITVICSKRGGDLSTTTHCEWLPTVPSMPDAIHFNFIPITSLLRGVPGKGFLSHAINLYLRYKPPISDLQYFLDFQAHRIWAPIHNDLPLGPTRSRTMQTPTLHFNLMGPKLYVNTTQVTVGKRPVTGMRLYLEGKKSNRLAIHLQHLLNSPVLLQDKLSDALTWRGSEEISDDRYIEAIQWKKFSHVCTVPIKYDPRWATGEDNAAFIVTGAQLYVKKHDTKSVLHLRLLYSKVSDFFVVQSNWMQWASEHNSIKSGFFSSISTSITGNVEKEKAQPVIVDSGVYPTGPPVPVQTQKLLKFVDTSQMCRGPLDNPGHWLVTGAKLDLEKGKVCLRVKFSLLNICSR
ncbi:MACPF domain-containing protein At1g14780-like [Olea europaea var. sylvestris]|uniref:MACPF domain-containing protein At1g14780-like n=1 Tax=Olea europaea var. sylvestris TaxID=158386 RepID=UPI000C1D37C4|nr:MACPF domain-containing protein At1g14780-like [Olea europaea var. sylvestris]